MHDSGTDHSCQLSELIRKSSFHSGEEWSRSTSNLERASRLLSHAAPLSRFWQLSGRRSPVSANREAVAVLCDAQRSLLPQRGVGHL